MKKAHHLNKLTLVYLKDFYTDEQLSDTNTEVEEKVEKLFVILLGGGGSWEVSINKRGRINFPWPTRGNILVYELTKLFFTFLLLRFLPHFPGVLVTFISTGQFF